MNLEELYQRIQAIALRSNRKLEDIEVVIPNNKNGIGRTSSTKVQQAAEGFDWDMGTFFIWPETKMVEVSDDNYIGDAALSVQADKQADYYAKFYPMKHKELSDDECKRLNDVAKGSYYIGYKDGYKTAKNK